MKLFTRNDNIQPITIVYLFTIAYLSRLYYHHRETVKKKKIKKEEGKRDLLERSRDVNQSSNQKEEQETKKRWYYRLLLIRQLTTARGGGTVVKQESRLISGYPRPFFGTTSSRVLLPHFSCVPVLFNFCLFSFPRPARSA